ncbi:hypothetical protein ACFPPD_05860 [Cohnella suwonensis]|uniref:Uncharacterized protein n=1 Tax=Cohnella suwonensis TaxID=696072 RepID=A0ABW0LQS7_9BACL
MNIRQLAGKLQSVREANPLAHNITNVVGREWAIKGVDAGTGGGGAAERIEG